MSRSESLPGHKLCTRAGRFWRLFRAQACSESPDNTAGLIAQIVSGQTLRPL